MTQMDDRVRHLLREVADEARPAPLLARMDLRAAAAHGRRRFIAFATAAAVAAAAVLGVLVAIRIDNPPESMPAERPPRVFSLAGVSERRPGVALMSVSLVNQRLGLNAPVYVVAASDGHVVEVPQPRQEPTGRITDRLSLDGTRLVRLQYTNPTRVLISSLTDGYRRTLDHAGTAVPELSPDNRVLATYGSGTLDLVDVSTGSSRRIREVEFPDRPDELPPPSAGLGWSPDGRALAVRELNDLVVVDLDGVVTWQRRDAALANLSMSWSPDGRSLIIYDEVRRAFVVTAVDGGDDSVLVPPTEAARPLGWAGSKVVWLAGEPGAQLLVTTDASGGNPQTWMRFDIGDRAVQSVTWSQALSGAPVSDD